MLKNYIVIGILSVVMLSAIAYGIFQSGSPLETRAKKFDETRVSNLTNLRYAIEAHYSRNKKLPEKLTDLDDYYYTSSAKDPETGEFYEYQVLTKVDYNLCANFSTASENERSDRYSYPSNYVNFDHTKGYNCFSLEVTPQPEPYSTLYPSSESTGSANF